MSGGYALLWPLVAAGTCVVGMKGAREWIVNIFRVIAPRMGVGQANVLADMVEKHEEVTVWYEEEKQRFYQEAAIIDEKMTTI
jgi:hypothetical protein